MIKGRGIVNRFAQTKATKQIEIWFTPLTLLIFKLTEVQRTRIASALFRAKQNTHFDINFQYLHKVKTKEIELKCFQ